MLYLHLFSKVAEGIMVVCPAMLEVFLSVASYSYNFRIHSLKRRIFQSIEFVDLEMVCGKRFAEMTIDTSTGLWYNLYKCQEASRRVIGAQCIPKSLREVLPSTNNRSHAPRRNIQQGLSQYRARH